MNNSESTKSIFIIEDNKSFARTVAKALEKEFPTIESRTFATGEEMLSYIEANPNSLPTIYILDYYLNSEEQDAMNGEMILEKLKKKYKDQNRGKKLRVIMLTANQNIEDAVKLLQKGALDYIVKDPPPDKSVEKNPIEDLKVKIKKILDFITSTQQEIKSNEKVKWYKKQMKYTIAVGTALGLVVIGFLIWYFLRQ